MENPTFNEGNPYAGYINQYRMGLMSLSPNTEKSFGSLDYSNLLSSPPAVKPTKTAWTKWGVKDSLKSMVVSGSLNGWDR